MENAIATNGTVNDATNGATDGNETLPPTILRYFDSFNAGEFQQCADLFAEDGLLYPPFESAIGGRTAIATYLQQEAKGMKATPRQGNTDFLETGDAEVKVSGQVQTPLFSVNVSWHFVLNGESEILAVRLRLMAALEDLLRLKP